MQIWLDPAVRHDCGDAMGPAAAFALASFGRCGEVERATRLISGVGEACLDEMEQSGAGAARYARALLSSLGTRDWHALARGMLRNQPGGPPALTVAATAGLSLAMSALEYLHQNEGESGGFRERWVEEDGQMLEQIVGGCLQGGAARLDPLTQELERQPTVTLRTLLELGAGRGESGSWAEVSYRDESLFGVATSGPPSHALLGSSGTKRTPKVRGPSHCSIARASRAVTLHGCQVREADEVPPQLSPCDVTPSPLTRRGPCARYPVWQVPSIDARLMCSWALEQPEVLEARDAKSLCSKLREFMKLNVFSSEVVQAHYRKCMSDEEWQQKWAGSIARFGRR